MLRRWVWPWLVVASGCGGIAIVDPEGGTGTGGATTTSSTAAATGGAGGAGGAGCSTNEDCASGFFCDRPGNDQCLGAGTCQPLPDGCFTDCPQICGCDGMTYCNECEAHSQGVDTAGEGPCQTYGAAYQAGETDEMVLWQKSLAPPFCAVIRFWAGPPNPNLAIAIPPPWSPIAATLTQEPEACDSPFSVTGEEAISAKGGVALMNTGPGLTIPCGLVFEATLTFDDFPADIHFDMGEVDVQGGCF